MVQQTYQLNDNSFKNIINYYRLRQIDINGTEKIYSTISIDNTQNTYNKPIRVVNTIGQEVGPYYKGVVIEYYKNNRVIRKIQ